MASSNARSRDAERHSKDQMLLLFARSSHPIARATPAVERRGEEARHTFDIGPRAVLSDERGSSDERHDCKPEHRTHLVPLVRPSIRSVDRDNQHSDCIGNIAVSQAARMRPTAWSAYLQLQLFRSFTFRVLERQSFHRKHTFGRHARQELSLMLTR